MKLVIVESPTKTKTIKKFLGKGYEIASSYGHVRDLPKSAKGAVDIEAGFMPHYEIPKAKEEAVSKLKKKTKKADEVILATDPDREGEAIAWHLAQVLNLNTGDKKQKAKSKKSQVAARRIVFHEITEEAVKEAMAHPRSIDDDLRRAQEARRVLDRLFGYELSGLIWKKVRYGLSAGRVQSPALRIIMEREREIRAFEPETYWTITAKAHSEKVDSNNVSEKDILPLVCGEEPRDKARMEEIVQAAQKAKWHVANIKERETTRKPRPPFTTSTLQQRASSIFSFSPARTMRAAQRLYEAGHITYMRTDSTTLSKSAQGAILSFVEKEFGKQYISPQTYKTKSKAAQEAHEAIRPTNIALRHITGGKDAQKLYQLIWQRAVASQMAPAKLIHTTIATKTTDDRVPEFTAKGQRIVFDGWFAANQYARSTETEVPKLSEGEKLHVKNITSEEKQTQPPPRYTEAGLVRELEKRGIGRPSTYAGIISTLEKRRYVTKEGRTLIPTDTGDVVSTFLEKHFTEYISDDFTAKMEDNLDEIATGERGYVPTLEEFYAPFHEEVQEKTASVPKLTTLGDAPKKYTCPECDAPMIIKLGKSGKFMSCSLFPDCEGARTMEGEKMEGPKPTGESCPECDKGELVERHGRYGKFIGCDQYPKCKYIKEDPEEAEKNSTGVDCPECKDGTITAKRGKYGEFYACSNYPDCRYSMNAKPTGKKCPMCKKLMMEGTKTIPERCSDKKCPNNRPDKLEKK